MFEFSFDYLGRILVFLGESLMFLIFRDFPKDFLVTSCHFGLLFLQGALPWFSWFPVG